MARTIPEWRGKTDNSAIPENVQLRVLDSQRNADGVPICPDCGQPIRPGQKIHYDHKVPLADRGAHTESNLQAIHKRPCHVNKTSREATQRAEARTMAKAAYGIKQPPKRPMPGSRASKFKRLMNGTTVRRDA